MLFRKKDQKQEEEALRQNAKLALTSLLPLCKEGQVKKNSFIIEDKDICVYADVISLKDDVAQIVYQLHHGWLEEPIMESVAASGDSLEDAVHQAALNFYENVLALFIEAIEHPENGQKIRISTQGSHDYTIYRGNINGVGRREGTLEGDFWDMLQENIISCIHNQKAYWVKIFASKNKNNVICEVRINNIEISSLSEMMVHYAENWVCKDPYHTEKQGILLVQDTDSYVKCEFGKEDILQLSEEAIALFEECDHREAYLDIRRQLYKKCRDQSLTHEIFFLIPELYCQHAYPQAEYGEKLYLVRKNEKTIEIQQSQMYSFAYVKQCVEQHFQNHPPTEKQLENVLKYSANAKALHKAMEEGNALEELLIPGIAILIPSSYTLR